MTKKSSFQHRQKKFTTHSDAKNSFCTKLNTTWGYSYIEQRSLPMLSRRRLGSTVTLLFITVVAIALILGQLPKNSLQESAIDSNKEKQEREKTIPETRSETSNPLLSSGNTNETEQKSEENSPVL